MASKSLSCPSSSSFTPTQSWTYEVFLSFRGEDTGQTFVDHLYTALDQKGIYAFKDDRMITPGKQSPISPELLQALKESRSDGAKGVTSVYHVDPSDVRRQKREFATAFEQHEEKFKGEMDRVNN
ncbi:hypothetical protein L1987_46218 [Smallanthus sonchifolius]|uniref:Uncharacterized protein n=2 Tax=Smallanthus sonchifolius TaxID=185202 RepID=A0ACB9FZP1_9ASTR|nr:hypothetical protein L1987_46217 [Smallanthus sonchifolius]KAI3776436.1 hypothetical protein L1987_46218 [Smallanthus sonchifolius]